MWQKYATVTMTVPRLMSGAKMSAIDVRRRSVASQCVDSGTAARTIGMKPAETAAPKKKTERWSAGSSPRAPHDDRAPVAEDVGRRAHRNWLELIDQDLLPLAQRGEGMHSVRLAIGLDRPQILWAPPGVRRQGRVACDDRAPEAMHVADGDAVLRAPLHGHLQPESELTKRLDLAGD